MIIKQDDLTGPEIAELLQSHLKSLAAITQPGSMHALGLTALRQPGITVWTAWEETELLGCGALKELDPVHGEIKSMRTGSAHLRKGVASGILQRLMDEARSRNYRRLSLETGSSSDFHPAHKLYAKFGFAPCGPFQGYCADRNSLFMTMELL